MNTLNQIRAALRKHALAYPLTTEDHPWGEVAFKVKGKIFVATFVDKKKGTLNVTVKLPVSRTIALTLPFAQPTRYGLAKSGWVTSTFKAGDEVPLDMLLEWVDESFRAVAPKRVVAQLENATDSPPVKPKRNKKA